MRSRRDARALDIDIDRDFADRSALYRALLGVCRWIGVLVERMNPPVTHDFGDGCGQVPAARHLNRNGSEGGWVAERASVGKWVTLGPDARVGGRAWVTDLARIEGHALVAGSAFIGDDAVVRGNAVVAGTARVSGRAVVEDSARVRDDARVIGAQVSGAAVVCGSCVLDVLMGEPRQVSRFTYDETSHLSGLCAPASMPALER